MTKGGDYGPIKISGRETVRTGASSDVSVISDQDKSRNWNERRKKIELSKWGKAIGKGSCKVYL